MIYMYVTNVYEVLNSSCLRQKHADLDVQFYKSVYNFENVITQV